jgi:hypothetical protein
MKISDIINSIQECRKTLKLVETNDTPVYLKETVVQQMQKKIEDLKVDLFRLVHNNTSAVLVAASEYKNELRELFKVSSPDTIVVDSDEMFERLANVVEPYLTAEHTLSSLANQSLCNNLCKITSEIGLVYVNLPVGNAALGTGFNSHAELVDWCRNAVCQVNAPVLWHTYVETQIYNTILEKDLCLDNPVIVLLVNSLNKDMPFVVDNIFGGRIKTFTVRKAPNESTVKSILNKMNSFYSKEVVEEEEGN